MNVYRAALSVFASVALAACASPPVEPATFNTKDPVVAELETRRPAQATPARAPTSGADKILAILDANIVHYGKKATARPDAWVNSERVAASYMSRARLTGSYDDYAKADEAIEIAFANAPDGAGPLLTRADLNATLHRFDLVEPDLAVWEKGLLRGNRHTASVAATRGDLALQRGDLFAAGTFYRQALNAHPSASHLVRMGQLLRAQGDYKRAEELLDRAIKTSKREGEMLRSWVLLQRGILDLDRGRLRAADSFFAQAEELFSGWYLIEEHRAEVLAKEGQLDAAERRYRDILARVPSAEFMDALADVLEAKGEPKEAQTWRDKAESTYLRDLERFPEATQGHALDHFLAQGDGARALDLARKNHALRPGPEAKVKLAQALVKAGETEDARALLEAAEETGWATPELHASAYWVSRGLGDLSRAENYKSRAEAASPGAVKELAWMGAAL